MDLNQFFLPLVADGTPFEGSEHFLIICTKIVIFLLESNNYNNNINNRNNSNNCIAPSVERRGGNVSL